MLMSKIQAISFSGGRTSAYMVAVIHEIAKKKGWDVHHIFMDTGAEHPKTYEFIRNIVKYWGIEIVCLRLLAHPVLGKANSYKKIAVEDLKPDLKPWKSMIMKYGTPSIAGPYCTARMKTEQMINYCNKTFGKDNYISWVGMRIDEPRRLKLKPGVRYLAEISDFEKEDILDWWAKQPFNLGIEEWLGNCVFCVKKSIKKLALAAKDEPEEARRFIQMLKDPSTREMPNRSVGKLIMYRGHHSLESINELYKDVSREDIIKTMRGYKSTIEDDCTESCELFMDGPDDVIDG